MGIVARDVSFSYGGRPILDKVSFEAEEGKLICVLGKNGVGKTTLFQILLGNRKSYSGSIQINGKSLADYGEKELAQQLAYIPQSYNPAYHYTVEDMVLMGVTPQLGFLEMPGKKHYERVEQALHGLHLEALRRSSFCHISSGEKQLVLIARAIAQDTKILVMDEPSSNLDYGNGARIMKLCQELAHKGYLILQSTHEPQHVFSYADEVLVLEDGRITAKGAPNECLTQALLSRIYQIPVLLHQPPELPYPLCCVDARPGEPL